VSRYHEKTIKRFMKINKERKYFRFKIKQNFRYYLAAFVSLITFVIYLRSLQNEFVEWDDITYVIENPYIHSFNMAFFRWAFLDFYASNWHPLTWISHAIDYAVWGLNPLGHHLTNIILHAANVFVVVLLVERLIGSASSGSDKGVLTAVATAGLLFGIHPLHVESVAWIAERKDLLYALFFLLSVTAYTKYVSAVKCETGQKNPPSQFLNKYYLFTLGMFVLALLSKPMAVTLPLVLLILDWYPFNRIRHPGIFSPVFVEKIPFFALSLCSSILTILAQKAVIGPFELYPLPTRLLVGGKALIVYLWKMTVPLNLVPYYAYPKDVSLLSAGYLLPIVLVAGITIGCIVLAKKQRLWLSAWSYYIVTLIPVLGIVQVGSQSMADRYTYLPSLGPFIVTGLMVRWFMTRVDTLTKRRAMIRFFSVAIAFSAFVTMAYLTFEQIGVWKNSIDLWDYVIDRDTERDPLPFVNRGVAFGRMGQIDRAREDFDKAIDANPRIAEAYVNRGVAFGQMGQIDRAREDFDKAIDLKPDNASAYWNRGNAYLKLGNKKRAISDFQKACYLGTNEACEMLQHL
jgi:tetratricopeptide (TPR) repeat protein